MANELKVTSTKYIEQIKNYATQNEMEFSDYQKVCVANAIRTLDPIIKQSNYVWDSFDKDNVFSVLQQVAFMQLNPSVTPRECYFIIRKNYDNKAKKSLPPTIEFGIEGAGNDVILRNNGVNVQELKSYVVYEGDDFDLGGMVGWDYKLPNHTPKYKSKKALYAVYLIKKTTGEIDLSIADRETVKVSLLANAKQNGASDELLWELNKLSLDEILQEPKWRNYVIKKTYGSNTYTTPLFNPSYTSPISMESMIERKLRNHATRRYPKSFNPDIQKFYEDTFGDETYVRKNVIEAQDTEEILEDSTQDFKEHANKSNLEDLEITQEQLHEEENPDLEEPLEEEYQEESTEELVEEHAEEEEVVVEETKNESKQDIPDWMR